MTTATAAPATASDSAGSQPAPSAPAAPQTMHARMLASLEKATAAQAPEPTPEPTEPAQPVPGEELQAGEERPSPEDGKEEGKEPDSIPMHAFKERLGRVNRRVEALRSEVTSKDFEIKKRDEAVQLLSGELERLKAALREGRPYDERDDQLSAADLREQSRQIAERIQAEMQEELRRNADEIRDEMARETYRASYERDIHSAQTQFPDVDRRQLIEALKAEAVKARPASAVQVAKAIHERQLDVYRRHYGQQNPAPPAPATVRRPGVGEPTRYTNNAAGMLGYLNAKLSQ